MKKVLSIILTLALMLQVMPAIVSADAGDVYYSQDFNDVSDLSGIAELSIASQFMSLSLADAGDEGIGEAGNNLLKLDMTAATAKEELDIKFNLQEGNEIIPVDRRLQFQLDFYKTDAKSSVQLFELSASNGRSKNTGLVQLIRDGDPAYAARLKDGFGNLIHGSNTGTTNDEKGIIPVNQWYRLTINWTPLSKAPDNALESVTLTRLSDNTDIVSLKDIPVTNVDYVMPDIAEMRIGMLTYNNYPAQQLYFDNISIRELEVIEELELISPDGSAEIAADSKLTLEFNKEVDADSIDGIFLTSDNFADPAIASAVVNAEDSKKVDLTFEYPLVAGGFYTVIPAGVKDADGNECTTDSVSIKVKAEAPANAYVNEDFSSLSNFTYDSSISSVAEDGKHYLKIAPTAANNANNGTAGDKAFVTKNIALDETGLIFETDYYPIGKGISDAIFYLKESQSPWGTARNGLVSVNVNSQGTPRFYQLCDGNTVPNSSPYLLEGVTGHSYNIKYHLSKRDGITYGKAYIRDNNTGEVTVSDEIAMTNTTYNVINEIGFAQRSWSAAETRYSNLFVYPASKPAFAGSDIAGEILEDYSDLSFEVKFDSVLDINSIDNIRVMAGDTEIASEKTLVGDSKTVRVDVTGSLPELAVITVVCNGVANTSYQLAPDRSFTFQTASAIKVTGCNFDKASIAKGETITADVSFTNNAVQPKNAAVMIAIYEKDGNVYTMKNIGANTDAAVATGNQTVPVSVTVPDDIDVSKALVKVIVLDNMTNMIPLCNDFTLGE